MLYLLLFFVFYKHLLCVVMLWDLLRFLCLFCCYLVLLSLSSFFSVDFFHPPHFKSRPHPLYIMYCYHSCHTPLPLLTALLLPYPRFMAPEVLSELSYTPACDIYSTAVVMYILLSGTMPFSKSNQGKILVRTSTFWGQLYAVIWDTTEVFYLLRAP